MVEPLINWNPDRLQTIAIILLSVGLGTIVMNGLAEIGFGPRGAVVLVSAAIVMTYQFQLENPIFLQIISVLSGLLAVVVPLAVCLHAFKVMVS